MIDVGFRKPTIVGILNITQDSFFDGGKYLEFAEKEKGENSNSSPVSCKPAPSDLPKTEIGRVDVDVAVQHALKMIEDGAEIIDIGGESTRPGATVLDAQIELERVLPVICELRRAMNNRLQTVDIPPSHSDKSHENDHFVHLPLAKQKISISIDTYKSEVARKALEAGADIVNDIYALRYDGKMIDVLKDYPDAKVVLMHMQGTPATMQVEPKYKDVVYDIKEFFFERIDFCIDNGITEDRIILDPGIGFGKTFEHSIEIIKRLEMFHAFGLPVMLGASRKSFINQIYLSFLGNGHDDTLPQDRLVGSLASTVVAFEKRIDFIRVHDVKAHREMIDSLRWIL